MASNMPESRKRQLNSNEVHYQTSRKLCPHCCEVVALKTYRSHKQMYFNEETNTWFSVNENESHAYEEIISVQPVDSDCDSPPSMDFGHTTMDSDIESTGDSEPSSSLLYEDEYNEFSDSASEPEEEWLTDSPDLDPDLSDSSDPESEPETNVQTVTNEIASTLLRWLVIFLLSLQAAFQVSDSVIRSLFVFLKAFLTVLGRYSNECAAIAMSLPCSLYKGRKMIVGKRCFTKYAVCRKCSSVYDQKSTCERCTFKRFPDHRQVRMRATCGGRLFKTVQLASGKHIQYPLSTYCYMSVTESLKALFCRPGFTASCEHWRKWSSSDVLRDVYDGKIWQEFLTYKGRPFLDTDYNLALTLNMDFFQPYKHITYSVGVIYGIVLNLPRAIRYKRENVILISVIPGPEEPKHDINSFLKPLVDELLNLWDGTQINVVNIGEKTIRCAVLCTACDIPAGRKMCGFLAHSAKYGCSRCLKAFPGTVGSIDYSGFVVDTWPPRTADSHKKNALETKKAKTLAKEMSWSQNMGVDTQNFLGCPILIAREC